MGTHRLERLQEEILHALSSILLFEVTDPRVKGITMTRVLLTKDLSVARIYYEASLKKKEEREGLQAALKRASHFIRKQLAPHLKLRAMPDLEFFYDETSDEVSRVQELFTKL